MGAIGLGAALGALLAFFLDPQSGARRRKMTMDRAASLVRGRARDAAGAGRAVASTATAVAQKVAHRSEEEKEQPNDATLARKVETEIFRYADAPKGSVDVSVQEGLVHLRGEVERPELIDELVERARDVQGVRDVENLLHAPGTQAPMHQ